MEAKGVGRKVIDKLKQTYDAELGGKDFAYDGEHSLFTIGALPLVNNIFTVVLDDMSSNKYPKHLHYYSFYGFGISFNICYD